MRRYLLFFALLSLGLVTNAQRINYGWPQEQETNQIFVDPAGQNITIGYGINGWVPFSDAVGYSVYGSRYRKAKDNQGWGIFLSTLVAPLSGLLLAYGIDEGGFVPAVIGGVALGGSLGAGIPLWTKGRKELDWMLNDYSRRYGPKPTTASVSFGPTKNGVGFALNF
ncbi:MAG: hypothetical protein IKR82_00680 [Bacteroidales bacterium]|nr:hypothetical protein [Bacteroidales bacterium]